MKTNKILLATLLVCLCFATVLSGCGKQEQPEENGFVQMGNPLVEVASAAEMEAKLGYAVPLLDKEAEVYIVLVVGGVANQGRIHYTDGSCFNIQKGSGDISGIYGGTEEKTETLGGVSVTFLTFEGTRYAIWEQGGFAYSLTGGQTLEKDVAALIG